MDEDNSAWHLDKRVPIAIIGAIIVQTIGIGFWIGSTSTRIDVIERSMVTLAPQSERIVRLETKLDMMKDSLTEIKNLLRPGR